MRAYVPRDGMKPASGLDKSGHASAMGLGWIVMAPKGDQPLILQKAGGLQGVFSYVAFAPTRGVGVFVTITASSTFPPPWPWPRSPTN